MVQLSDAIPFKRFNELFATVEEEVAARNTAAYYVKDPSGASTVNLFVWDEGVSRGLVADSDEAGHLFRHEAGHCTDLKPASVPI